MPGLTDIPIPAKAKLENLPLTKQGIPPLENGDQLSRAEFHRRYEAMPHVKKAELIEGIVHMPSPVNPKWHGEPHSNLCGWLVNYRAGMPGTAAGDNATVYLDLFNEPQPDVFLRILPKNGGQTRDTEDDYIEGGPEFIGEVSSSSASYDMHSKKTAYCRNGVREYLVWLTREKRLESWALRGEEYVALPRDTEGVIRSEVFPGLWLDAEALLRDDMAAVLAKVREGLASSEAEEFRRRLEEAQPRT